MKEAALGRPSTLPHDLVEALWQLGYGGKMLRVPDQDVAVPTGRSREVLVDLLRRAEDIAEWKKDASPATVRLAWETVRAEGARHGLSVEPMHRLMNQALRDIGRWWQGERRRLATLRQRPDGPPAMIEYRRARRRIAAGEDPPGVEMDILCLAAESIAAAWWYREPPSIMVDWGMVAVVARLAVHRMESPDIERMALVATAKYGLGAVQLRMLQRAVECGLLMAQADLFCSQGEKDASISVPAPGPGQ